MGKINVLDKKVYNRIAAGEVVERPFSVVKELVENSLDAKATAIEIQIENAGKSLVQVTDNGCGIAKDDLEKTILAHATSKIKDVDDLNKITTLGFRVEALASIASVSQLTLVSRAAGESTGYILDSQGGEISGIEVFPSEVGTCVTVEKLFFNTPARAKFLRSDKAEEADITNILARLIFANPEISFKLISDGAIKLQSFGGGLAESIIEIYGYDFLKRCFEINAEKSGVRIHGYLSNVNFTKPNRTYQTVILNGRYIVNSTVQSAIHNAYAPYIMKRQYPAYVLFIDLDPAIVDVNVTPDKSDVRFVDNQAMYAIVNSLVAKHISEFGTEMPDDFIPSPKESKEENFGDYGIKQKCAFDKSNVIVDFEAIDKIMREDELRERERRMINEDEMNRHYIGENYKEVMRESREKAEREAKLIQAFNDNKMYIEELEKMKRQELLDKGVKQEEFDIADEFRVVGQILKTYIVIERGEEVFMIDQHAAHERLLFDKFLADFKNNTVYKQDMIVPYELITNDAEFNLINEKIQPLRDMGFDVSEADDNLFYVYSVPSSVGDCDLKSFFDDLLSDSSFKKSDVPEVLREKIAQKACKSAIKAGKDLSDNEMRILLNEINK
ncbi:MAG: DNA mismatch repair endonuclease MutL, partial [Clostridia bacterium]|nr:DNA mismatch repair endonuclease MutL [Clostridia bacterium]